MRAEHHTIDAFLEALAAKSPTPGGGAVAPLIGAHAAALASMVVAYSLGRKSLAPHQPALEAADSQLRDIRRRFLDLAEADAAAYARLNEAMRLPADAPGRTQTLGPAALAALQPPEQVVALGVELLQRCAHLAPITNRYLHSDLAMAAVFAEAAARASRWNILVNLPTLRECSIDAGDPLARADGLLDQGRLLLAQIESACLPPS
ncbi:MAG: cyclodeaminase/cyclohydrolase family protein [Phycisphaerales bacterium]|nr:cyclodeaminase/cyclohydrolase family protein [Phycisphaerales bacterium]